MHYRVLEKKKLPKSEFLVELSIPAEEIRAHEEHGLKHYAETAELPGFRKGHVPKDIIRSHIGELSLWEEAAREALSEALANIFQTERLDVIGRPRVESMKLAPDNPAEFRITLSLLPTLSLPDYKKIAAEEGRTPEAAPMVEEKEIDAVIEEIKRQHEAATPPAQAGGKKDFVLSQTTVKELGAFETVTQFRSKVKEGILGHKKIRAKEKRRASLLDRIVRDARGDLPDILIESELDRMEAELKGEIERLGARPNGHASGRATLEEYLAETKKTMAELRRSWTPDAEKRARLQLTLSHIARAEHIAAPKEMVDAEVKHVLKHYKDAQEESVCAFVETLLTNQKVIEFLESQK